MHFQFGQIHLTIWKNTADHPHLLLHYWRLLSHWTSVHSVLWWNSQLCLTKAMQNHSYCGWYWKLLVLGGRLMVYDGNLEFKFNWVGCGRASLSGQVGWLDAKSSKIAFSLQQDCWISWGHGDLKMTLLFWGFSDKNDPFVAVGTLWVIMQNMKMMSHTWSPFGLASGRLDVFWGRNPVVSYFETNCGDDEHGNTARGC